MKVTPFQAQMTAVALGGGIALLGARINSSSQEKRDRRARETERRHVAERDALVAVQDALEALYRLMEEELLRRFPHDRPDPQVINVPPEPLEYRVAEASVSNLQERILDDELRELVEEVVSRAGKVLAAPTREDAWAQGERAAEQSRLVHKRIGERLRRLYKP